MLHYCMFGAVIAENMQILHVRCKNCRKNAVREGGLQEKGPKKAPAMNRGIVLMFS